ncbi:MAG: DUF4382 domain-containing protein [Calditrichaeota bacterium]|nr:DUF4382 domain-containing protein [Calditrichota bacterium]
MRKQILILPILLFSLLLLSNCEDDSTGSSKDGMGTLNVSLTDAPADFDSVIIHFSEISAHIDSDWVQVMTEPMRINLLEWNNGKTVLLGSSDVPAGKYTQIRIKVDSAFIGVNGEIHSLDVPSGMQTGLKLGPEFTIDEGTTYQMVMDFDACQSIVTMGPKKNPHGYKLKPHIRLTTMALSGSVSGTVLNFDARPTAYAILGTDTVTSTFADTLNGMFKLAFLEADTYRVVVEDTLNRTFNEENVVVSKGKNTNLGDITLQ